MAVSGGGFEALGELQVGSVQLVDTVDRTTFALAGPDSVPEGQAFITYTVSGPYPMGWTPPPVTASVVPKWRCHQPLEPNRSYVVDLGAASKEVSVVADEFSGSTDPSGPTDVYTISYLDEETGETATASVTSLARLVPTPPPLSLPAFGSGGSVVQQSLTPIGTAVNVSGDGIGFQNNLLSSYP